MSFDRAALRDRTGGSLLSPVSTAPNPYLQLPSPVGLLRCRSAADLAQRQVLEPIVPGGAVRGLIPAAARGDADEQARSCRKI